LNGFEIMQKIYRFFLFGIILLLIGASTTFLTQASRPTKEAVAEAPGEPRTTEIVVTVTQHIWWLNRWSNNEVVCSIPVEHENTPSSLEVLAACGDDFYNEWLATQPCGNSESNASSCDGLYLFLADIRAGEKTVTVELPKPTVHISLSGCIPTPPLNECENIPSLILEAQEPLPNEHIIAIHVLDESTDIITDCAGAYCQIPLKSTDLDGNELTFWAESSYGDSSKFYKARVRIVDGGVSLDTGKGIWYVDVISTQWKGVNPNSCAETWEAFLPLGGVPHWLQTPEDPSGLASNAPFVFLAARLIENHIVDAHHCINGGLIGNGAANTCGVEAARGVVNDWQDQFDQAIFMASARNRLPAQLVKNLFAQESQFWPGHVNKIEFGLGQLTELGADAVLLWNIEFFEQFCPLVFHEETCAPGYAHMETEHQEFLRGALAAQSSAKCDNCSYGIDLAHAQSTIDVFAATIKANCEQTSYIVYDVTNQTPGVIATYEDLWRFTLVNYNAGPGCLQSALEQSWALNRNLSWDSVATRFSSGCIGALTYVDRITGFVPEDPDFVATVTPTPTIHFTVEPTMTNTPGPSPTPSPTEMITSTATQNPAETATPQSYPAPDQATATPNSYP
jgi:hypothetical protein